MIRINYTVNNDGDLVSNLFPLRSDTAFIIIYKKEKKFQLRGISNDGKVRVLSEGIGTTLSKCKLKAKSMLISYGYEFDNDIRNKIC